MKRFAAAPVAVPIHVKTLPEWVKSQFTDYSGPQFFDAFGFKVAYLAALRADYIDVRRDVWLISRNSIAKREFLDQPQFCEEV